jgi:ADP-heptose:LPS heptosyltransferase
MKLALQRAVDRWVGIPLCALASGAHWMTSRIAPRRAPEPVRAIVVILLSEMGSLVLAHGMFRVLREQHPHAAIHVMLFGKNRAIVDLMGLARPEHIHSVDDRSLGGLIRSLATGVMALRRANVDVAIDCELFSRISSLLSWASGAAIRVGFHRHTQEGLYRGSHMNRKVPYNPYQHIGAQFETLARAIRSNAHPVSKLVPLKQGQEPPMVSISEQEHQAIRDRLAQDHPLALSRPLVLVYPGGGILPIRAWPLEHYRELCKGLIDQGACVAIIGLAEDKALAQTLVSQLGPACLDFTGYTKSIRELLALFHQARLLIANDGGPGQFAALTPLHTIMFFGPETPALYAPLTARTVSFYSNWPCSPCLTAYNHRQSFCDGDNQCLKAIAPQPVLDQAIALLHRAQQPQSPG